MQIVIVWFVTGLLVRLDSLTFYERATLLSCFLNLKNARYLVWKYRSKKEKLWKNLEKKYGAAVLQEDEWENADLGDGDNADGDEPEDLDEETSKETTEEQDL